MKYKSSYPVKCMLAAMSLLFLLAGAANAYDTGHHNDLCRSALADEGFTPNSTAIDVVVVENWLVDYYASSPTSPAAVKADLEHLHFDNLDTAAKVGNYWAALTNNTRTEVLKVAAEMKANPALLTRNRLARRMLVLMGVSLHAVQDFYTHSNWVETFPKTGKYRSNTWFDTPAGQRGAIRTGTYPSVGSIRATDHGDYDTGMNHDSYNRPRFAEAYVFSYAASRQWIKAIKSWSDSVDPFLWPLIMRYGASAGDEEDLQDDLEASYRLSEWLSTPKNQGDKNGAWKGKGSGSAGELLLFAAGWTASPDSVFVDEIKSRRAYLGLMPNLKTPQARVDLQAAVPARQALNMKTVEVGTTAVSEIDSMDYFGVPDFYAIVRIDGQPFVEAMQIDKNNIKPDWLSIKFVPAGQQSSAIDYVLVDEDGKLLGSDDIADIHPSRGKTALKFKLDIATGIMSGDLAGRHNNAASAVESKGDGDPDRARISIFAASNSIEN